MCCNVACGLVLVGAAVDMTIHIHQTFTGLLQPVDCNMCGFVGWANLSTSWQLTTVVLRQALLLQGNIKGLSGFVAAGESKGYLFVTLWFMGQAALFWGHIGNSISQLQCMQQYHIHVQKGSSATGPAAAVLRAMVARCEFVRPPCGCYCGFEATVAPAWWPDGTSSMHTICRLLPVKQVWGPSPPIKLSTYASLYDPSIAAMRLQLPVCLSESGVPSLDQHQLDQAILCRMHIT